MPAPFVSILIVNFDGQHHLDTCLSSVLAQDYPRHRFEVLLIDNGSSDASIDLVRRNFPSVGIVAHPRNLGFAGAYHAAIPHARGEYLAFLNNDTRVEVNWLTALVRTTVEHGAAAVGSRMLSWDGSSIDFCGGVVSILGHAWQRVHGESAARHGLEAKPLLFPCGGAMLVERAAYEAAGGFDPEYFAYFEDVDLGWRLTLLGHTCWLSPQSIVYHRLHGTSSRSARAPLLRLYERNALRTMYKCLGGDLLDRALPVAVALTLARGLRDAGPVARDFTVGRTPPEWVPVSRRAIATLIALEDFSAQIEELETKRQAIQASRVVSDDTILRLMVEPLRVHELGHDYEHLAAELFEEFGLSALGETPEARLGRQRRIPHAPETSAADEQAAFGDPPVATLSPGADRRPTEDVTGSGPFVSIVLLTALGPTHLPSCLESLRRLEYPKELLEVVVVDNGSTVDPEPAILRHYPEASLIRLRDNVGFSAGNAAGARAARGQWLAFLNDDTRVDPRWLVEMLATAERHGAPCVAARILDWDGQRIDFAGAAISFEGKGFQVGIGSTDLTQGDEERPLLFACGAAMLIKRDLFEESGGFDQSLFAYYEDLALGWFLWLLNHEVWFSPASIVYHRHHGTSDRWMTATRTRLYERNSLRNIFTYFEDRNLGAPLTASLLLASARALIAAGLSAGDDLAASPPGRSGLSGRLEPRRLWRHMRAALARRGAGRAHGVAGSLVRLGFRGMIGALASTLRAVVHVPGTSRARSAYLIEHGLQELGLDEGYEVVSADAAARLIALVEWLDAVDDLRDRRRRVQRRRCRSDQEILGRFDARWTSPVRQPGGPHYEDIHERLVRVLGLDGAFRPT